MRHSCSSVIKFLWAKSPVSNLLLMFIGAICQWPWLGRHFHSQVSCSCLSHWRIIHLSALKVKDYNCVCMQVGCGLIFPLSTVYYSSVFGHASCVLMHETVKNPANQQSSPDCLGITLFIEVWLSSICLLCICHSIFFPSLTEHVWYCDLP